MVVTSSNSPNALRRALLFDAAASGAMGPLFLIAAGSLSGLLGLPLPLVRYVGWFLTPFAAGLLWIATRSYAPAALIRAIVVGNQPVHAVYGVFSWRGGYGTSVVCTAPSA